MSIIVIVYSFSGHGNNVILTLVRAKYYHLVSAELVSITCNPPSDTAT